LHEQPDIEGHIKVAILVEDGFVAVVNAFLRPGKPMAAIRHGAWTVLESGNAEGRRITRWPSLQTDLRNGGASWTDEEVVVDRNLVTSRKPDDIPAFNREMIELFEGAASAA
jgi:protease I